MAASSAALSASGSARATIGLRRHRLAGDAAEHRRIGDAVAAEPVGAVHAAGVLAGDEQAAAARVVQSASKTTPPIM